MKRDFLNQNQMSHLAKITTRRFPGVSRNAFAAYRTDGGDPDTRTEEELLEKIQERINTALETRATKEELQNLKDTQAEEFKGISIESLRAMADDKTGVMQTLATQGLAITRLKNSIAQQPEDMSIRSQIKRWLDSPSEEGSTKTVKQVVMEIRGGKKSDLKPLELDLQTRVNSPMLPANTYGGSAYIPKPEIAPGIVDLVRPEPTFWDYIRKGSTSSAAYVWVNKKNPLGSAAFIAPGVYKPGISFTIATEISNAKKIAANEKVAIELLDDVEGLASWVEEELLYQVKQNASLALMSGTASSTEPAGIQTLSVPYSITTVSTTNPNNWDCIRACVAQLRSANFKGAVTAFMNPIDYANMVMSKAITQGQLFIPPQTGATIVEDNNIPVGSLQVAILDNYKVKIYKGFTMTWGLENDDFTKNLRTVIGEMRIHQYFSENHVGSFIFDTYANITSAITA